MATPRYRHADAQIALPRIAIQQRLIRAEQQHEDARAMLSGDLPEPGGQRAVDRKAIVSPA